MAKHELNSQRPQPKRGNKPSMILLDQTGETAFFESMRRARRQRGLPFKRFSVEMPQLPGNSSPTSSPANSEFDSDLTNKKEN